MEGLAVMDHTEAKTNRMTIRTTKQTTESNQSNQSNQSNHSNQIDPASRSHHAVNLVKSANSARVAAPNSSFRQRVLLGLIPLAGLLIQLSHPITLNAQTVGKRWSMSDRVSLNEIQHDQFDELLKKYVDKDGMVDYFSWHRNSADRDKLKNYLDHLGRANLNVNASRNGTLAYWINAYNAVTLHGILDVYPTSSIRNHTARLVGYNIWKDLKLISGDNQYSLDEIEHKILRPKKEPRIHFAIVCASIGCPRLLNQAYTATKLESQLKVNSLDFFSRSRNLVVDSQRKSLKLSAIMSWFGKDFGATQTEQLKRIYEYLPEDAKTLLANPGYRIEYLEYDWSLNEQASK